MNVEEERYIEIVTTYSPMVYRVALHDCRNHADAEDIMQNVLLRLYRFGPRFDSEEHLRRWLIQVTVRESRRLFAKPFRKREELFRRDRSECHGGRAAGGKIFRQRGGRDDPGRCILPPEKIPCSDLPLLL